MFGAESGANVVEFVDLRVGKGEFVTGFAASLHEVHVIDGIVEHALQQRGRRVYGQVRVHRAVKARVAKTFVGEHNDAHVRRAQDFEIFDKETFVADDENVGHIEASGIERLKAGVLNSCALDDRGAGALVGLKVNRGGQLAAAGGQNNVFGSGHSLQPPVRANARSAMVRIITHERKLH